MARAVALQVTTGLLLLTSLAPMVQGASVEGFLEVGVPVSLEGMVASDLQDPTILLQNTALASPDSPILFTAEHATITRHIKDVQGIGAADRFVSPPGPEPTSETLPLASDITVEISGLARDADILIAPHQSLPLVGDVRSHERAPAIAVALDGLRVLDGYRKQFGEGQLGTDRPFNFEYERAGPLLAGTGFDSIALEGGASVYVWGAIVTIRNATQIMGTYETGYTMTSTVAGVHRAEHFEYLTFELEGFVAQLEPGDVVAQVYAPAAVLALDGTARLPAASGTFTAGRDFYRATGEQELVLQGNLSLAITALGAPERGAGTVPALATVHVTGDLTAASEAPLPRPEGRSTTTIVAVGAGSATVVGVAAWYILATTGVVAVPLTRRKRHTATVLVPNPGEMLFDTDRFTLYHLARRHAGLSATEARALTGIEDARAQLDALVEGGLLVPMADEPRRYALPGLVSERRAQRIAYLRDPAVHRVARLLVLHGLMPESALIDRAAKASEPARARQVREMLPRFEHLGLVRRERGEGGLVADPTDELFACLKLMGEFVDH